MSDINEKLSILIITCREDYPTAKKLTSDLKRYRIPKNLIGQINRDGKVAANIDQIFINLEQLFYMTIGGQQKNIKEVKV